MRQIKVVCNKCYGGFGLSRLAKQWMNDHGVPFDYDGDVPRHHPVLVECVETLGKKSFGDYAALAVYPIAGNRYRIDEYDGMESVVEPNDEEWTVVDVKDYE
jgi:hypothetical protein